MKKMSKIVNHRCMFCVCWVNAALFVLGPMWYGGQDGRRAEGERETDRQIPLYDAFNSLTHRYVIQPSVFSWTLSACI